MVNSDGPASAVTVTSVRIFEQSEFPEGVTAPLHGTCIGAEPACGHGLGVGYYPNQNVIVQILPKLPKITTITVGQR